MSFDRNEELFEDYAVLREQVILIKEALDKGDITSAKARVEYIIKEIFGG